MQQFCEAPCADVVRGRCSTSWQAQHFVHLHVLCRCRSWQVQHFVAGTALCASPCVDFFGGRALCEPPCADFVAGTESGEFAAENWLLCSATLARGVCGKLEAEKWPLCRKNFGTGSTDRERSWATRRKTPEGSCALRTGAENTPTWRGAICTAGS